MARISIHRARTCQDISQARGMFSDYANWLADDFGISLAFQGIAEELAGLPGKYAPPDGEILLARDELGDTLGVIALRPFEGRTCEIKRLYVLPEARGRAVGKELIGGILEIARAEGYDRALLDTAGFMASAQRLYEAFGFADVPAYYDNPFDNMRFMAADLNQTHRD